MRFDAQIIIELYSRQEIIKLESLSRIVTDQIRPRQARRLKFLLWILPKWLFFMKTGSFCHRAMYVASATQIWVFLAQ